MLIFMNKYVNSVDMKSIQLVATKVLGNKLLVAEEVLGNKILLLRQFPRQSEMECMAMLTKAEYFQQK